MKIVKSISQFLFPKTQTEIVKIKGFKDCVKVTKIGKKDINKQIETNNENQEVYILDKDTVSYVFYKKSRYRRYFSVKFIVNMKTGRFTYELDKPTQITSAYEIQNALCL